jgi:cytochrome b involved in lipid metabolism
MGCTVVKDIVTTTTTNTKNMDTKPIVQVDPGTNLNLKQNEVSSPSSATGSRQKVEVGQGYSLMDWIRFHNSMPKPFDKQSVQITTEELAKHNRIDDAWTVIHGIVYGLHFCCRRSRIFILLLMCYRQGVQHNALSQVPSWWCE